jgi:hypothetical protein
MKTLILVLVFLLLPCAVLAWFESTPEECIRKRTKGTISNVAVEQITRACHAKYGDNKIEDIRIIYFDCILSKMKAVDDDRLAAIIIQECQYEFIKAKEENDRFHKFQQLYK